MSSPRYLLVISPWLKARDEARLGQFCGALRQQNIALNSVHTSGNWQGDCQLIGTLSEQYTDVIAVGGDGTVNLVVNALVGTDCRLGILPAGTGNDFYRSAYGKQDKWLAHLMSDHTTDVDVGRCHGRYFINILGLGFDAYVVQQLSQHSPRFFSALRYPWVVIKTIVSNAKTHLVVSSNEHHQQGPALSILFGNGQYFSKGVRIIPEAEIDSGSLFCQWMAEVPWYQQLWQWLRLLCGARVPESLKITWQSTQITIESEGVPIQGDGEYFGVSPTTVSHVCAAIKLKRCQ